MGRVRLNVAHRIEAGIGEQALTHKRADEGNRIDSSALRMERAEAVLLDAIEQGIFPGCAVRVESRGRVILRRGYGRLSDDGTATGSVTPETMYDLASLTKPLACASSLLVLVEAGLLCLTDEIGRFFHQPLPHLKGVTIRALMTHTSGLPAWDSFYARCSSPEMVLQAALATPLDALPGDRYVYSDIGYILLGEVAHKVSGLRLDDLARETVFQPLSMTTTGFWAMDGEKRFTGSLSPKVEQARIAPTRHCPMRPEATLVGEVHDANGRVMAGVSGHAGLFGTVDDVAAYLQMLIDRGRAGDGSVFLSDAAVRLATTSQVDPIRGGQTLGWFAPPNAMHVGGDLMADRGFSHSGFTGTSAFGDPETGLLIVLLTNAVYGNTGEHLRVRRRFHNAVASAILTE